jgi:hypothetical protein
MNYIHRSERGFTLVETAVVVLILILIGVAGYAVHTHSDAQKLATRVAAASEVGWKTYHFAAAGLTFRYPSSWLVGNYGNGAGVTVSSVANPVLAERSAQTPEPQDNSDLVLNIYDDPSYKAYLPTDSNILDSGFLMNGQKYCLIGTHNVSVSGDPITIVSVNDCKANNSLSWTSAVPIGKGALEMSITSAGDGDGNTVPVVLTSTGYATIKLILQTATF